MNSKIRRAIFAAILTIPFLVAQPVPQLHAASLTTEFNSNNGESGNMFDVVTLGGALTVTGFDLNLNTGSWNIEIYTRPGSWVGHNTSSAGWTLVDTIANVTSNGMNNHTFVDVTDFTLAALSTTGLYITTTAPSSLAMLYTDGTAVGNTAAQNSDLQILEGAGIAYPFSDEFEPRVWNGTIYYATGAATPLPAALPLFATGLGGLALLGWRRKKKAVALGA